MAKITAPFLALSASGTIAKTLTASKWRGRPYLRQRVVPANPNTVAQQSTRNTFRWSNDVWKRMGTISIAPWNRFADGQALTGRNSFQGNVVADNRGEVDLDKFNFSIGAKGGIPPIAAPLTAGVGEITVDFTEPVPPTGWVLTAAQAAAITDQDPATGTLFTTTEGEDLVTPFQVVLTGLTVLTLYRVGAWLKWAKPDGSVAYSSAINANETTL